MDLWMFMLLDFVMLMGLGVSFGLIRFSLLKWS